MPVDARTLEPLLAELNEKIDRLRVAFEQYYLGIELTPPELERQAIARTFAQMAGTHIANTALKFKYQSLCQKWASYTQYWNRVAREIEAGTYVRHVQRARRRYGSPAAGAPAPATVAAAGDFATGPAQGTGVGERPPEVGAWGDVELPGLGVPAAAGAQGKEEPDEDIDALLDSRFVALTAPIKQSAPPPPPPRALPPPIPRATSPAEPDIEGLYQRYVAAQRQLGRPTDGVRKEAIAATVRKQLPALLEKHRNGVDFEVVVKDGRAILKAVPRR